MLHAEDHKRWKADAPQANNPEKHHTMHFAAPYWEL